MAGHQSEGRGTWIRVLQAVGSQAGQVREELGEGLGPQEPSLRPPLLLTPALGPGALQSLSEPHTAGSFGESWMEATEAGSPCSVALGPDPASSGRPECPLGLPLQTALLSSVPALTLAARSFLRWFAKALRLLLVLSWSHPQSGGTPGISASWRGCACVGGVIEGPQR